MFAFRADQQTQGRGQKQNCWQSPKGMLYVILKRKPLLDFAPRVGFGVFSFPLPRFGGICVLTYPKEDRGRQDYQDKVDQ